MIFKFFEVTIFSVMTTLPTCYLLQTIPVMRAFYTSLVWAIMCS